MNQLFLKIALGLSLSGISVLGLVIPGALKNFPECFSYTFSFITGTILAVSMSWGPVHVFSSGNITTENFFRIRSIIFMVMLVLDNIHECKRILVYKGIEKMFEKLMHDQRAILAQRGLGGYDDEMATRKRRTANVNFSQLKSSEDECEEETEIDENGVSLNTVGCYENEAFENGDLRKENEVKDKNSISNEAVIPDNGNMSSQVILVVIGIMLAVLKGLYISSRDILFWGGCIKLHLYCAYVPFSIGMYLDFVNLRKCLMTFLLLVLAMSPLFGCLLFLSQNYVSSLEYSQGADANLSALFCGAYLYTGVICMAPLAVNHVNSGRRLAKVYLVALGFFAASVLKFEI